MDTLQDINYTATMPSNYELVKARLASDPEYRAAYNRRAREWYHRNKIKALSSTRTWQAENREHLKAYNRAKRKTWSPEYKEKVARMQRNNSLKRKYGIPYDDYQARLKAQKHRCALCPSKGRTGPMPLDVDHCHGTGKVRGLLCSKCNRAIGLIGDTAEHLARALEYLREH